MTEQDELFPDLNIVELVDRLWAFYNHEYLDVANWFGRNKFEFKKILTSDVNINIFCISYIDGICNIWNTKWSRQCRGIIINIENNKCEVLSEKLQRGAEVTTGFLYKEKKCRKLKNWKSKMGQLRLLINLIMYKCM